MIRILKGTIVSTPILGKLQIDEDSYLVAVDGYIKGIYKELPVEYKNEKVDDYTGCLIMQSFSDLHLHAPQYPMLGTGMDLELLDWLTTHTFPVEGRFKDSDYARGVYHKLANELVSLGTTRVSMFSSLHKDATIVLMEELEAIGITGYVGKVNMDRGSLDCCSETTKESIEETISWLDSIGHLKHIKPSITPRFTPSCTNELMEFLGNLVKKRNLAVQSHLSENKKEIELVKSLHPDCERYYETYEKYGLWNNKTLMAHCVYSDEIERKSMKDNGVSVVYCNDSNTNVFSGVAPIRQMLNEGLNVVLGSDIAGGDHLNGFDVITSAIRGSKVRYMFDPLKPDYLTIPEAWYLATSSANIYFGEKPGFAEKNEMHVMVIDDSDLDVDFKPSINDRFERVLYRRQKNYLKALYALEEKII